MKFCRVSITVMAALSLATGNAFALPLIDKGTVGASSQNPMFQHAAVVCDAWGRCWQTGPFTAAGAITPAIEDIPAVYGTEAGVAAGATMTGMAEIGMAAVGAILTKA